MKNINNTESNDSDKFFRNAALVSGREWSSTVSFGWDVPKNTIGTSVKTLRQIVEKQIEDQIKNLTPRQQQIVKQKTDLSKVPNVVPTTSVSKLEYQKYIKTPRQIFEEYIKDFTPEQKVIAEQKWEEDLKKGPGDWWDMMGDTFNPIKEVVTFPLKLAEVIVNTASELVSWVPIVGDPLSAIVRVPGLEAINNIVDGMRIDKAIISDFSNTVSSIKGVMPIASAISVFVPGLGIGIAAGLAGAKALIDKIPISPELIQATANTFSNVKGALEIGLKIGGETAVNKDSVAAILNGTNEEAKKALTVGVTLGAAKRIETKTNNLLVGLTYDEKKLNSMTQVGEKQVQRNSAYKAIADTLEPETRKGFVFALGLMTLKCTETAIKAARNSTAISDKGRVGFDMGLAAKIGSTTKPPVIDPKIEIENIKKQAAADLARAKKEAVIDLARAAKNAQIAAEDNAKSATIKSKLQQRDLEIAAQDAKKKADRLAVKAKEAELEALANQEQAVQYATEQAKTTDVALTNAAYFITQGMKGAPIESKVAQLNILMKDTASKLGADLVVEEVKVKQSLWGKFKSFFGFHGECEIDELT